MSGLRSRPAKPPFETWIHRRPARRCETRDYAEAGLTRAFRPAKGVALAASARLHRTEKHYEYSYRVLGTVALNWRLR
jgi:hypothetical protein